ncbi:MAG TPA: thioredoxin-dependent thiol peroxidase [bacterium]|nr:thioredoxin-dependent thiol peroxidase [bacterium]
MPLAIGAQAPAFELPDQKGVEHRLDDYRGKWVLLYFYPKDSTPGCTTEACTLRDSYGGFQKLDAIVLGVSTDSVASHAKFAAEHALPFSLLADTDKRVVKAYDVWGPKTFMGKEFLGTKRISYLIDPQGRIAKVYASVKPADHADEVLKDMQELQK